MNRMFLSYIACNVVAALVLHCVAIKKKQHPPPRKGELVMYFVVMSLVGSLVALFVACRFAVTFMFDWTGDKR